ncbi:DNA-binding protein [Variovorax sp. J2P1-59]|uniref:PPC domain-containing DNA-binding protein n=1 Tax=Variovorax flavidus TaxID=3053501 RepID=UPI002576A089|nr:PPC domain-containing DNA-binding protein [Variovorax sp. J2P1-59]MDM0073558.1 DNA-binding protein [Variovorax sp. J2P1-59]
MDATPLRLNPGDDLRHALDAALASRGCTAAFVVAGVGSLSAARLRFAGVEAPESLTGDLEILTLTGTLSPDGSHLHMSVADARGSVFGGHVAPGCLVRTTAEVLVAWLPEWRLAREFNRATGYAELAIRKVEGR